jgi:hypothetical protein
MSLCSTPSFLPTFMSHWRDGGYQGLHSAEWDRGLKNRGSNMQGWNQLESQAA